MIILSSLTALNLQACVRLPDSRTLQSITISYVPDERLVESKSLKLYLFSFRNHGDFHEDVINIIMKDLVKLLEPKYIEVWGKISS